MKLHTGESGNVSAIFNAAGVTIEERFFPLCGDAVETRVVAEDHVCGSPVMGTIAIRPDCRKLPARPQL